MQTTYHQNLSPQMQRSVCTPIVITKDEDFRNSFLLRQTPKKLVRITLGNISNQMLIAIIERNLPLIAQLNIDSGFYLELGKSAVVYTL